MIDQFPDNDNGQHRIRQERAVIHTNFGSLVLGRNQTTTITETGDIVTDDAQHLITVDGLVVSDPSQILGQCTNPDCGKFLTALSFGYCVICRQARCPKCSVFDDITGNWLCTDCYAQVRKQRFWRAVRDFFTRPFRRG